MKIAVIMFGGKRGGIEQAAVDYCEALKLEKHDVTAFVRTGAAIIPDLAALSIPIEPIASVQPWNMFARKKLNAKLKDFDVLIVHGNRAGQLTSNKHLPPVIAVAHSRFFNVLPHFAAIIALAEPRARSLGTPHVVPNMIRLPNVSARDLRQLPVIGVMGRMSHEKGFDLFLEALAILRDRGMNFRAVVGGNGPQEGVLKAYAARNNLTDLVTWQGWVTSKTAFYNSLDIFCMPSRTESFPITLLEAMAHALPIVVTDCGGPAGIITDRATGILTAIDAGSIANALAELLEQPARARSMATAARNAAERRFALPIVAKQLSAIVQLAAA